MKRPLSFKPRVTTSAQSQLCSNVWGRRWVFCPRQCSSTPCLTPAGRGSHPASPKHEEERGGNGSRSQFLLFNQINRVHVALPRADFAVPSTSFTSTATSSRWVSPAPPPPPAATPSLPQCHRGVTAPPPFSSQSKAAVRVPAAPVSPRGKRRPAPHRGRVQQEKDREQRARRNRDHRALLPGWLSFRGAQILVLAVPIPGPLCFSVLTKQGRVTH